MSTPYRTLEGEMLDAVVHRHYGVQAGATEAVLEANTHIASLGAILPTGTVLLLPDLAPARVVHTVRLWGDLA